MASVEDVAVEMDVEGGVEGDEKVEEVVEAGSEGAGKRVRTCEPEEVVVPVAKSGIAMPTTKAEKIEEGVRLKTLGNEAFAAGDYSRAVRMYTRVFLYVRGLLGESNSLARYSRRSELLSAEQEALVASINLGCYNNLAACYLKLGKPGKALENAKKALAADEGNVKALYRAGSAYIDMNDFTNARRYLKSAAHAAPKSKGIRRELKRLRKAEKAADREARATLGGMFDRKPAKKKGAADGDSVAEGGAGSGAGEGETAADSVAVGDSAAGDAPPPADGPVGGQLQHFMAREKRW
eukprot:PLAT3861.2.p1 GENE.PLAT3861.2~~PLAT3861.2.p1  ORF type:complete len:295 (-),score=140.69 PLAT3861.2:45-929(-)